MITNISEAKQALDKIIDKARVHFYKPIQIAEILYRDRVFGDINLGDLETYRNPSKRWRDVVCMDFIGRRSTSSARYQDDLFNANAVPQEAIALLGELNRDTNGAVESYIYDKFSLRFNQMATALNYCEKHTRHTFVLSEFIDLFWSEPGLRRSIDKIYEIVVYSLFSSLVEALEVSIEVSINPNKRDVLIEFEEFANRVINLSDEEHSVKMRARINRVGVTNAADRGLDMWANFGLAIQIKHLSLTEELAENIVSSATSDRIVIVCKESEESVILSLLAQIGWKSKIQSIITESDLKRWYDKALIGKFSDVIGDSVLSKIISEIALEFPSIGNSDFEEFYIRRGYNNIVKI